MRLIIVAASSLPIAVLVTPLEAQGSPGSRAPVDQSSALAPVLSARGLCRVDTSGGRRNIGIMKLIGFADSISEPRRLIALGLGATARPRMLTTISEAKGTNESVIAFFDDSGHVVRGYRGLNGDAGLLPGDTAAALVLARSILDRCPG
jgi:hypothetical protein